MNACLEHVGVEPEESAIIVGCVEEAQADAVHGWVMSLDGEPVVLQVLMDGVACDAVIERHVRPDVYAQYGDAAMMSGFSIALLSSDEDLEHATNGEKRRVEILANGVGLRWRGSDSAVGPADSIKDVDRGHLLGSYLDSVDPFTMKGWALRTDGDECEIRVCVNGQSLGCPVIRVDRADVAYTLKVDASNAGFEIFLPGYMWQFRDAGGVCEVEVYADCERIKSGTVHLETGCIEKWLNGVREYEEGEYADFLSLLALEHIKYSGILDKLQDETSRFVAELSARMNLDDFLQCHRNDDGVDAQFDNVSAIMLRDAMLELNTLMHSDDSEIYPLIKKVYKKYALKGTAKEWYLNLAVQLTCATGEFGRLGELTDFHYLDALRSSQQPHQLALLLPVLVSNGEVEKATEVMRQVAKYIDNSWLPSECLAHAVKILNDAESEGRVDIYSAEKFRLAFVSVLDGFKAGWFSRLHDKTLVATMVSLLAQGEFYTDYHRRELINAAVRVHGLSPVFWKMKSEMNLPSVDTALESAQSAWDELSCYLQAPGDRRPEVIDKVLDSLDFFKNRGNREALVFMTEVVVNCLNHKAEEQSWLNDVIARRLTSAESTESLRVAAHPLSSQSGTRRIGMVHLADMMNTIRGLGNYHRSSVYEMQTSISHTVDVMRELVIPVGKHGAQGVASTYVREIERKSALLGSWQGMFLGVDVLLMAYQVSAAAGCRPASVLMNAIEMIRKAVNESDVEHGLPAPICAAIGRAVGMSGDPGIDCFLAEVSNLVKVKFGNRYHGLFSSNAVSGLSAGDRVGWNDTLVLIDTTRERLNRYGDAIRETWAKELNEKGIPYLFVVGGDGGESGRDVLELDVPDKLEYRVAKTLKTYAWVLENSRAQYVIKVADNAFVDVQRYFGSLSYRKHHYYGKIVKCSEAKMDRQWHQGRVDGEWSKKSLEKSSGSTSFVNGRFACSLSRVAIMALLDSAATNRGKRLTVSTYSDDKLVGDLLAMNGIGPCDEDFDVYVDEVSVDEIMPGEVHGGAFLPGRLTPGKIAVCNHEDGMRNVAKKTSSNELWPKKIWPSYQKVSLKPNANQLELVSEEAVVERLLEEDIVVVSVVRNEMVMLPQFLEHYRALGAKCFIFVDNGSDDGTREYLVSQPDTILYSAGTEYRHSHYGVSWQQAVVSNHCLGKWVLLADADEFLVYEGCESKSMEEFVADVEGSGDNGVILYMIDMYPYGDLADADFEKAGVFDVAPYFDKEALIELRFGGGMYSNSRNFVNGLRHRIAPGRINAYVSQKYAMFKYYPWVRLCEGVHYAANMTVENSYGFFAHFKYHSGFKSKVEIEVKRKQHYNGAEEYRKYAGMMAESSGGFGLDQVSEKYAGSQSFTKLARRIGLER